MKRSVGLVVAIAIQVIAVALGPLSISELRANDPLQAPLAVERSGVTLGAEVLDDPLASIKCGARKADGSKDCTIVLQSGAVCFATFDANHKLTWSMCVNY